jgi:HPt (histidine-containing phosphotransfer) domain-containing protein
MSECNAYSTNDNKPHFNKSGFSEKLLGNNSLFIELIEHSIIQIPDEINNLKKAFDSKDIERFKLFAHKLKGTALNMCFERLACIAIETEETAENNFDGSDILCDKLNRLEGEWHEVKEEIEREL